MEPLFEVHTNYDQKALSAMCRALRKTKNRRKNRLTHFFAWLVIIFGLLAGPGLCLLGWREFWEFTNLLTVFVVIALILVVAFEDSLNGWISRKRLLPGVEQAVLRFYEEDYEGQDAAAKTRWQYDRIDSICESEGYYFFFLSKIHGQILDKGGFSRGNAEEFRRFIQEKTGRSVEYVK